MTDMETIVRKLRVKYGCLADAHDLIGQEGIGGINSAVYELIIQRRDLATKLANMLGDDGYTEHDWLVWMIDWLETEVGNDE